jgi:hypothetical protein
MNNLVKVLIGVGVVAAVATTTYVVTKKKKEEESIDIADEAVKNDHKDDTILERIKTAAYKKAVKIIAWAIVHKDQIEGAAAILGLVGALFSVINAIREFRNGKKMQEQMDFLVRHAQEFEDIWNVHMTEQASRFEEMMNKLKDIHLDMSLLHEIQEMLVTPIKKKGA